MNNASTHLVRSAIEELKQKKTNNNNNKKPQPLSDKSTNNNNTSSKKETPTAKACLQSGNKNGFSSYYFYLDNIGAQDKNKLTGRITLLGGNIEPFFSKKCTHVITSKYETTCNTNKITDQENIPPCNKQKSQSDIVDKAKQWNIQVWGFNKAFDVMGKSIHNRQDKKKQLEKKVLGDVYQNDKRFGPSTGTKDHARRPQFVEFTGNYLVVEDMTKVHRPPIIKEYTKQVLDKNHRHFPWPYLRNTPDNKSPFDRESEKEPEKNITKKQENHHDNINKHDQQDEKQKIGDNVAQNVACLADTTATAHKNNNTNNNADTLPVREASALPGRGMDSQMRASGFQPSMPNTQSGLHCVSGLVASQPKAPVDNTRKPVLENLIKKVPHLSQRQEEQQRPKDVKIELSRKQQQRKEHDGFYCENCHERFTHFKEHIKSESHQAFIKDENNFKELDLLLEKTQRPLKKLENKKRPSEFAVDMTDIQAPYTKMLKHSSDIRHPPSIHIEHGHSGQENWGKYHHVFLENT